MYEIRLATDQDLKYLAMIHKKSYSKIHFTSYFSLNLIEIYYSYFIKNNDSNIYLAIKNEEIYGFLVCGKNIAVQLSLFKKEQRLKILKTVLTHPLAVLKKINISIFNKFFDFDTKFKETNFLILSIVSTGKEKGLGSFLLEYVKNYGFENSIVNVGLYVRISNITAINSYLRNDYKILGYISGQYYMEQNNLQRN